MRLRLIGLAFLAAAPTMLSAQVMLTRQRVQPSVCDTSSYPTVMTVEGGGSLGVYEAGMSYLLVDIFKRKGMGATGSPRVDSLRTLCLSVVTGASAGNINAFLAATSWCDRHIIDGPEQSIFWKAWITTGLMQLFPARGENPSDTALFSRRHFDGYINRALKQSWGAAQWQPGCHVQFGATVTRLFADSVQGAGALWARNQRMAFALSVSGIERARDTVPVLEPFAASPENYSFGALKSLRPGANDRIAWDDAFTLIKTSSGYPLAFQPLRISYCTYQPGGNCEEPTSALALDGGVFDNGPVAFAYSLWLEHHSDRKPVFLYLSPDRRRAWPGDARRDMMSPGKARTDTLRQHGLRELATLVSEFLPTARQYEAALAGRTLPSEIQRQALLQQLAAQDSATVTPAGALADMGAVRSDQRVAGSTTAASVKADIDTIKQNFRTTARWHPLAGDWVLGFGAFFGRPLREYDFSVGMYDAAVLLAENLMCDTTYTRVYVKKADSVPTLRSCVATSVKALIADTAVHVGGVARPLLLRLYYDEFERGVGMPAQPLVLSQGDGVPRTADDSSLVVVDAVREALYQSRMKTRFVPKKRSLLNPRVLLSLGHCSRPGIVTGVFCDNGVVDFLDGLHENRRATAIINAWADHPSCDVRSRYRRRLTGAWERPDECRVERRFAQMIGDPEGNVYTLTRAALRRIEEVTPRGSTGRIASALLFAHGSAADRHRRNFDLGFLSLPPNIQNGRAPGVGGVRGSRLLWYALPSSWGLTPNIRGWGEFGWEVRAHMGTSGFAVAVPVHLRPKSEVGNDGVYYDHTLLVPGVRFERKALPFNSRAGMQWDYWCRPSDGWGGQCFQGWTRGYFVSVGGKLNLMWSQVPGRLPYRAKNSGILTFGIGDTNGIAYWVSRLVRG